MLCIYNITCADNRVQDLFAKMARLQKDKKCTITMCLIECVLSEKHMIITRFKDNLRIGNFQISEHLRKK